MGKNLCEDVAMDPKDGEKTPCEDDEEDQKDQVREFSNSTSGYMT